MKQIAGADFIGAVKLIDTGGMFRLERKDALNDAIEFLSQC